MSTNQSQSYFAYKFNMGSPDEPARWNKEWETVLCTLSSSESASSDVYRILSDPWSRDEWKSSELLQLEQDYKKVLFMIQKIVVNQWDVIKAQEQFVTAWPLLEEAERERHVLRGLKEACISSLCGQDARALCPELSLSLMLNQQGTGFTDFIEDYRNGKKAAGEEDIYLLPNEWWQKAVGLSDPSSEAETPFRLVTMVRNEFIGESISDYADRGKPTDNNDILYSHISICHDDLDCARLKIQQLRGSTY